MQTKLTVQKALIYQRVTTNPRLIFYVDCVEEKFYNISLRRERSLQRSTGTFSVLNSAELYCPRFEYFTTCSDAVKAFRIKGCLVTSGIHLGVFKLASNLSRINFYSTKQFLKGFYIYVNTLKCNRYITLYNSKLR